MLFEKAVPHDARDAYRRDAVASILGGIYTGAIFPFIGFIARDRLGASVGLIGLMTAAPFLGHMFALFYANAMEGRRKMPFVVWSRAVARALFIFALFVSTPLAFAVMVAAVQIIATVALPAYVSVLREIYPDDHRGRIMGYIRVGLAFTTFLATLLVGPLLTVVSFRYVFPIAGMVGVASALTFGTIRTSPVNRDYARSHQKPMLRFLWSTLRILRDDLNYRWFAISVFTFGFGNLMVMPLYPVYQVDRLHITAAQVAVLASTSTLIWMFSYLYWGKYVDRRSPLKAVAVNVLMVSLVPFTYFLATDVWMLLPAAIISGITMGGIELSYFNSILYLSDAGRESQYQALHSFLLGIRGTIAPFVGAALVVSFKAGGMDVRYVFLIAMGLMLLGCGMQLAAVRARAPA